MPFDKVKRHVEGEKGYTSPRSLVRNPRTGELEDPSEPLAPTTMARDPKTGKLINADYLKSGS